MKYLKLFEGFLLEKDRKTYITTNTIRAFLDLFKKIPKNEVELYYISLRTGTHTTLINPHNTFQTPTGTYTYPLYTFYNMIKEFEVGYDEHNKDAFFHRMFPYTGRLTPTVFYMYKLKSSVYKNNILKSYDNKSTVIKFWNMQLKGNNKMLDKYMSQYENMNGLDIDNMMIDFVDFINIRNKKMKNGLVAPNYIGDNPAKVLFFFLLNIFGKAKFPRFAYKNGLFGFVDYTITHKDRSYRNYKGENVRNVFRQHPKQKTSIPIIHKNEPSQAVFFGGDSMYDKIRSFDMNNNKYQISTDDKNTLKDRPNVFIGRSRNSVTKKIGGVSQLMSLNVVTADNPLYPLLPKKKVQKLDVEFKFVSDVKIDKPTPIQVDYLHLGFVNDTPTEIFKILKPVDYFMLSRRYSKFPFRFPKSFKVNTLILHMITTADNFDVINIQSNAKELILSVHTTWWEEFGNFLAKESYNIPDDKYNRNVDYIFKNNKSIRKVSIFNPKKGTERFFKRFSDQ